MMGGARRGMLHFVYRDRSARWQVPVSVHRWALTGFSALALDVILFSFAFRLTPNPIVANGLSSLGVIVFTYVLNHSWTFRSDRGHISASLRYSLTLVVAFALNTALVSVGLAHGLSPLLAKLGAIPFQAPASYLMQSRWVFASRKTVMIIRHREENGEGEHD